jgi:protein-S-isoprenylcysteine O-methyltransferase Ste14
VEKLIAIEATDFEYRHQTLLHLLLVGLAVATYLFDQDDIVWAVVRHHTNSAFLEQAAFGVGTLMLFGSAALETWASAYLLPAVPSFGHVISCDGPYRYLQYPLLLSRLLFALVLGLLVPLPGTILLVGGEALLAFRLVVRDRNSGADGWQEYRAAVPLMIPTLQPRFPPRGVEASWGEAFRWAASKWGLTASMIVFTLTLRDRIAEIGGGISFLIWLALNFPRVVGSHDS